jgi:hypothetical protein
VTIAYKRGTVGDATLSAIIRRRSTNDELREIIVRQARSISGLKMRIRHLEEQAAEQKERQTNEERT